MKATGKYYNFSNIRYAEPPVGNLRFAAPVPLRTRDNAIADGSQGKYCPQSLACWFDVQNAFVTANLSGKPFDFQASYAQRYANGSCLMPVPAAERNLQESEDCLFLDVFVPDTILEKTAASRSSEDGAPVLVYFQDGGFVGGFKSGQNPAGLIQSSRLDGSSGMIYVGFNYRVSPYWCRSYVESPASFRQVCGSSNIV